MGGKGLAGNEVSNSDGRSRPAPGRRDSIPLASSNEHLTQTGQYRRGTTAGIDSTPDRLDPTDRGTHNFTITHVYGTGNNPMFSEEQEKEVNSGL